MVDEGRVERLLRRITEDVAVLRQRAAQDRAALRQDRERLDAVKYAFVVAIEGCIRVAHHLGASESWAAPATNADAFRVLAGHGVLGPELARRLGLAAGFRNLLVHGYADVDDQLVIDRLDDLGDLDAYVDAVLAWMDQQGSAPPTA